ncbi:MAG: NAD(P)H-binding protein [Alphaproteobacteria bacterium]|nr:NAD(P)H-binding protein [Alphaproteobacteria bacterium]
MIRAAGLTDSDEVAYETTKKGEPFKGTEVSRKSVAAYVMKILEDFGFASRSDVGIDKPGTDGDKPTFL